MIFEENFLRLAVTIRFQVHISDNFAGVVGGKTALLEEI